jgi:hypothetical protein
MSNLPATRQVNLPPPTQGDDVGYELEFTQAGAPVDISGWTVRMTIKRDPNDDAPVLQAVATISDAGGGIARINLASADTESLIGQYFYDIEADTGQEVRTLMYGMVPFTEQVTS